MTDPKRDDRLLPTVRDAASNLLDVLDRTPNNGGPFLETIAACRALRTALAAIEPLPLSEWELVQERAHTLGFGENDPIASETTNACYDFAAREMHVMSEVLRLRAQRGIK